MKYWIFATGVVLILAAVWVSNQAMRDGVDASACYLFGIVGVLLTASGVGIHAYDNYVKTEEGRRRR